MEKLTYHVWGNRQMDCSLCVKQFPYGRPSVCLCMVCMVAGTWIIKAGNVAVMATSATLSRYTSPFSWSHRFYNCLRYKTIFHQLDPCWVRLQSFSTSPGVYCHTQWCAQLSPVKIVAIPKLQIQADSGELLTLTPLHTENAVRSA